MSDIVERLRGLQAEVEADRPFRYVKDIFKEAADEIERLIAALHWIAEYSNSHEEAEHHARRALEGNRNDCGA